MRYGVAAAALAALACTAPAASAAAPLGGETYEGTVKQGIRDVILVVSARGDRVARISGSFHRGCRVAGRKNVGQLGLLHGRNLSIRNGRFSYRRTIRYPRTGGRLTTRFTGRFVDGGARFVGTFREVMVNPQMRSRCDSRTIRMRGAAPLRALVDGAWKGATAQGRPLAFSVDRKGLHGLSFEVVLTCTNGEEVVQRFPAPAEPLAVDEEGRFRGAHSANFHETEIAVEGQLSRKRAAGTITASDSIERTVVDSRGREDARTFSCSATVPFTGGRA